MRVMARRLFDALFLRASQIGLSIMAQLQHQDDDGEVAVAATE